VIAGRGALNLLRRLAPPWYAAWLGPLGRLAPTVLRLLGLAHAVFGLRLAARLAPLPAGLAPVAAAARDPLGFLWRASVAHSAERTLNDLLPEFVPPGGRVLDLGCGEGDNLATLLADDLPFGSYLGLDPSPSKLARARARFAGLPKIDFIRNDLVTQPLPTGEYDLILSTWALDRVADPLGLVVRALRQLRSGGHTVLLFESPAQIRGGRFGAFLDRLAGRHGYSPTLYRGLPDFTALEQFAGGRISLVLLEKPVANPQPKREAPPDERPWQAAA
jgi:SAM-dependent methyltransferase